MTNQELTPARREAAEHLLWAYGYAGGVRPGSFTQNLITLWESADAGNRLRLTLAFPDMAWVVNVMGNWGGALELQKALGVVPNGDN